MAIDGNLTSRWSSGRLQDGTDWFKVDFGGTAHLTSITLNNTKIMPSTAGNDYPASYSIFGSTDGINFSGTAFAKGNGSPNSTAITFGQQTVRAIKITESGARGVWWSIGELQTACSL